MVKKLTVNIVGAGLAGSECAWQLASRNIAVNLYEMRDENRKTFAHQTQDCAELVCSNSLRCHDVTSAIGLLHEEMRILNSLIIESAIKSRVPAGNALAVDRKNFSNYIKEKLLATNNVKIIRKEIEELPLNSDEIWIIATGPLTSDKLSNSILRATNQQHLSFFDAIAPIIYKDSIDFNYAWMQSRYDKGDGKDYINCPLTKDQYYQLVDDLLNAKKTEFKEWEKDTPYFDGCLPVEEMARRGRDVLRYGPLKPIGLTNQQFPINHELRKPYAVIQLRQDNKLGTLYNIVGFQTKLKYGEQKEIFAKILGLQNAEFARYGGIHRNIFINSPQLLDCNLRFKKYPNIFFTGQVTGVEGYVESAAMGLICAIFCYSDIINAKISLPSCKTAIGALLNYITLGSNGVDFQPMNVNFGLFETLKLNKKIAKKDRRVAYSDRAIKEMQIWQKNNMKFFQK